MNYIGRYNEQEYCIYRVKATVGLEEVYRAGNSPFDSQAYVPIGEGVGLDKMKKMCVGTGKEIAAEEGKGKFLGVEYDAEP